MTSFLGTISKLGFLVRAIQLRLLYPKLTIGDRSAICSRARFSRNYTTRIGSNVFIGFDFYSSVPLSVSDDVMIAPRVSCVGGDHDISLSVTPMKSATRPTANPIVVERGAWIGCNVVVLHGVTVGEGAVVGAGSVLTKSIPPYSIAFGNPAKVVRFR